ncbi:hypothetical protein MSG28_002057 [Choristoneura fumiferana]|uniref:Uncharacterized protein n=1 Tax=Choristoneura fumiferana TaxID=7141 RepID=A0ACC0JTM4_CHOFU|nr:hypothetical protein MSG28_002057 [Choristoneura fumiferana]
MLLTFTKCLITINRALNDADITGLLNGSSDDSSEDEQDVLLPPNKEMSSSSSSDAAEAGSSSEEDNAPLSSLRWNKRRFNSNSVPEDTHRLIAPVKSPAEELTRWGSDATIDCHANWAWPRRRRIVAVAAFRGPRPPSRHPSEDTAKFIAPTIYIIDVRQKSESTHPSDAESSRGIMRGMSISRFFASRLVDGVKKWRSGRGARGCGESFPWTDAEDAALFLGRSFAVDRPRGRDTRHPTATCTLFGGARRPAFCAAATRARGMPIFVSTELFSEIRQNTWKSFRHSEPVNHVARAPAPTAHENATCSYLGLDNWRVTLFKVETRFTIKVPFQDGLQSLQTAAASGTAASSCGYCNAVCRFYSNNGDISRLHNTERVTLCGSRHHWLQAGVAALGMTFIATYKPVVSLAVCGLRLRSAAHINEMLDAILICHSFTCAAVIYMVLLGRRDNPEGAQKPSKRINVRELKQLKETASR